MTIQLRDDQVVVVDETRDKLRTHPAVLIQSPCGFGKTVVAARMTHTAASRGKIVWFLCHRRELVRQAAAAFDREGIDFALCIADARGNVSKPVQICSIPTLAKRFERYPPPDLIIWDEAHHCGAATWRELFRKFPKAKHVGLSATPMRLDGQGLGEFFGDIVIGPSPRELIDGGRLSPYRLFSSNDVDTSGLHKMAGDWAKNELEVVTNKPKITGSAIQHYQEYAAGRRAVAFCVSIKHSQAVVDQFNDAGIPAFHLDGCADTTVRDGVLADFADGKIKVLSSVDLLIEGFDLPAIECAILLRPTQSLNVYLQSTGRAMRTAPGKENCIILDHVDNFGRFGYPDVERYWSLAGREATTREVTIAGKSNRVCSTCFAATKMPAKKCCNCGEAFAVIGRKIKEVEGTLKEVPQLSPAEAAAAQAKREAARAQGMSNTVESLTRLGQMRGMKNPEGWAKHVMEAREKKKGKQKALDITV